MLTRHNSDSTVDLNEHVVTENWLQTVLFEYFSKVHPEPKVTVNSFKVTNGSESSESVLSDIIALSIEADVNEEKKLLDFIIKLLPLDPFSRYFVKEAQFDLREIKFYTQLVPDLLEFQHENLTKGSPSIELPVPTCYLAKYVPIDFSDTPPSTPNAINESIIILEDLKKKGYQNVSFKKGLSLQQAESAFKAVSKLHALSLAVKVYKSHTVAIHGKFFSSQALLLLIQRYATVNCYCLLFAAFCTDLLKRLRSRCPELFQEGKVKINDIPNKEIFTLNYSVESFQGLPQLIRFLEKREGMEEVIECLTAIRPKTRYLTRALLCPTEPVALITHTDFWSNNLLFKDDECLILDWQMVTYSRPTNDLALLIISSLPAVVRRQHSSHLLDLYWSHLRENSIKLDLDIEKQLNYSREDLSVDYKSSQLLALLLCIGSVDVALRDAEIEERLLAVLTDLLKDGVLSLEFINQL